MAILFDSYESPLCYGAVPCHVPFASRQDTSATRNRALPEGTHTPSPTPQPCQQRSMLPDLKDCTRNKASPDSSDIFDFQKPCLPALHRSCGCRCRRLSSCPATQLRVVFTVFPTHFLSIILAGGRAAAMPADCTVSRCLRTTPLMKQYQTGDWHSPCSPCARASTDKTSDVVGCLLSCS